MAVFTLRTLVLRGVSVVRDGQNVGLRLGAESRTACATPEVRINPRHPSPDQRPDAHAEYDRMAATAAQGTGRSLSDGSRSRRGAARSARPAILFGWRKPQGTPKFATAKRLSTTGKRDAVENAAALARPLPLIASAVRSIRLTPADWTRSASTWAS